MTLANESSQIGFFQWSPNGESLAYWTSRDDTETLTVVNVETGDRWARTFYQWNSFDSALDWSPDSTRLTFRVTRPQGTSHPAVLDVQTDRLHTFDHQLHPELGPRWWQDGSQLMIWRPDGTGRGMINLLNTETKLISQVTVDPHCLGHFTLSSDERWLACNAGFKTSDDGAVPVDDLFLYELSSVGTIVDSVWLTQDFEVETYMSFSPDAQQLAYGHGRTLRLMDLASRQLLWEQQSFAPWQWPVWSPDGQHILAQSLVESEDQWMLVDASNGEALALLFSFSYEEISLLGWSPDNRFLLIRRHSRDYSGLESDLFLLTFEGMSTDVDNLRLLFVGYDLQAVWRPEPERTP
jgi:Tol biopolymer transport system component